MDKNMIINILTDWNYWKRDIDSGVLRPVYISKLKSLLSTGQIIAITGPRRSGKSYIMRQFAKKIISGRAAPKNTLMINFEDPRFEPLDGNGLQTIYETYLEFLNPDAKPYIFLDEVQEVDGWEKWVRTMDELGRATLIITGSNAKLLSSELSTLLTGRHVTLSVLPLSFEEQLGFNGILIKDKIDLADKRIEIMRTLNDRLEFGAFPKVVLSEGKKEILLNYYDDMLSKDLVKRFKIRKPEQLKSLARFYLSNVSSPVTFNSIEKFLDITADTAEKFSSYFQEAFLFFFVKRFSPKVKEQENSPRKVYAIDTGLANAIGFGLSKNIGPMAECTVYLELLRRSLTENDIGIFYWKDAQHREVDFVIKRGTDVKELIQVSWDVSNPKTRARETGSLLKAMDYFGTDEGYVITGEYEAQEEIDGKRIVFTPLWKWLIV